jgi:hypothetical protein
VTLYAIFELRKRVNSGLPTFMQTCSPWSIETNLLVKLSIFLRTRVFCRLRSQDPSGLFERPTRERLEITQGRFRALSTAISIDWYLIGIDAT